MPEEKTMLNGIFPRILHRYDSPGRYPGSRDFATELKCQTSVCPYNDKRCQCVCPASVEIGADGRCGLYEEYKAKEGNRQEEKKPKKNRCQDCQYSKECTGGFCLKEIKGK